MATRAKKAPAKKGAKAPGLDRALQQYITLRDKIKALDEEHSEKMKPFREKLFDLNVEMLERLREAGATSMATPHGTVYESTRTTASVADPDAFMSFVEETGLLELVERRANMTAVRDYVEEHEELPPGVNLNTVVTAGVRRK